jgi:predicted naringenin-chalcone synthase
MNGFKTMFSAKIVSLITNWLESKLATVCSADKLQLSKSFKDDGEN